MMSSGTALAVAGVVFLISQTSTDIRQEPPPPALHVFEAPVLQSTQLPSDAGSPREPLTVAQLPRLPIPAETRPEPPPRIEPADSRPSRIIERPRRGAESAALSLPEPVVAAKPSVGPGPNGNAAQSSRPTAALPSLPQNDPAMGSITSLPRHSGMFTSAEISRLKRDLRLSAEQEGHWPPVESALREIGAQQLELVRAGRRPEEVLNGSSARGLFWAARPLLNILHEHQKEQIRKRARMLGLESVVSMI
jgi:hypothetical protein